MNSGSSIRAIECALDAARKIMDPFLKSELFVKTARSLENTEQREKAISVLREVQQITATISVLSQRVSTLAEVALLLWKCGDHSAANAICSKAEETAQHIPELPLKIHSYGLIVQDYFNFR